MLDESYGPGASEEQSSGATEAGTEPLACVSCRARKLKCDRTRPACTRCVKVNSECVYPESRRKPTFKRRNVKELEARLAQVEDYLKEVNKTGDDGSNSTSTPPTTIPRNDIDVQIGDFTFESGTADQKNHSREKMGHGNVAFGMPDATNPNGDYFNSGQLISLGQSEALPPFEVIEELHNLYFAHHHHFIPVVHSGRYYHKFYSGPLKKPPMCLQYAIWAMASIGHDKYDSYSDIFYKRARQYADADEMKGEGEHFITIAHAQAWAIIASYEAKNMLFTRASVSCAKTVRLVHMMGLDRLDGGPGDLPTALPPPTDWTELEERRRVFWGAFTIDSHASIATGWPSLINTDETVTRLPASEQAFESNQEEKTVFLNDVFHGASYQGFSSVIVVCSILKNNMTDGEFWKRHRDLDNNLSSIFMFLPERLRMPQNSRDPAAVHLNLNLHAATISLHHTAIEKIVKHNLPESAKLSSLMRLKTSAEEIVNIVKMVSHTLSSFKSPMAGLGMYCAVTVYIYFAREAPEKSLNPTDMSNLQILVRALEAITRVHKLSASFLQQATLDIELNGLSSHIKIPELDRFRDLDAPACARLPLVARTSVTKVSESTLSVLPTGLPYDRGEGGLRPTNFKLYTSGVDGELLGTEPMVRDLTSSTCFQPIIGAASRNVAYEPTESVKNKRKRMTASPAPDAARNPVGFRGMNADNGTGDLLGNGGMQSHLLGSGIWKTSGTDMGAQLTDGFFSLPDRTNSSVSSPMNRPTATDTLSGSSSTSPAGGLGNSPEDKRIDLRILQDRMSGPIWPTTDDVLFNSLTDPLGNNPLASDGGDPWGILNAQLNLNWDNNAMGGDFGRAT